MNGITAIALFSGGLDSILACRVIAARGIRVCALKFVTPFFDHHLLADEERFRQRVKEKYGIEAELVDLSSGYLELLRSPAHGFGKNFNPCIDCKIMMLRRARELMEERKASFLITGEVLGQRPMSQRLDTLHLIAKEAGCADMLLRPLSAKRLTPTLPERQGWVDREQLHGFSGRGRTEQLALAKEFCIRDFPAPAGGCVLTDPNLSVRIQRFYAGLFKREREQIEADEIRLLLTGRQFRLPGGQWLVLGRNERENDRIADLRQAGDWLLRTVDRPGPVALLRGTGIGAAERTWAAGLVARYSKKDADGSISTARVLLERDGEQEMLSAVPPLENNVFRAWIV
jgi:hypothetical protein